MSSLMTLLYSTLPYPSKIDTTTRYILTLNLYYFILLYTTYTTNLYYLYYYLYSLN